MKRLIFILFAILLLAFVTSDIKMEYILPLRAYSLCSQDLDLDGDYDIVVGHNYSMMNEWSGISILINNGNGYFDLFDSVYLFGGQTDVKICNLNKYLFPEIIGKYVELALENEYISVIYDFNLFDISYFSLYTNEGVEYIETGDIDGDGHSDIIVASNGGKFWGVLYNDGSGDLSEPDYYYVDYYPTDIKCGDLNNDGRDDIVIASEQVEIYYSDTSGFIYYPIGDGEDQISIVDFDNDGDLDIVGNAGFGITAITMYENTANNSFYIHEHPSFQPNLGNLTLSDFNNDSLPDVLLESVFDIYILYNQNNFSLSEPAIFNVNNYGEIIHHFACADIDGNKFQDIIFTRLLGVYKPNLEILFNDGNGNFVDHPLSIIQDQSPTGQQPLKCYPNPFIIEATIDFYIANSATVELSVVDLSGNQIICLINQKKEKGKHSIKWSGLNQVNQQCRPGTYFIYLRVNGEIRQADKIIKY